MGVTPPAPVQRILLAGSSGLVGGRVLARLLEAPQDFQVVAPVRRNLTVTSPRLVSVVADLGISGQDALRAQVQSVASRIDAFLCCLGTTLKTAGSREAFLAVDRDLVLRLAELARELGARRAVMVSSVGASAQSNNFYLRVKGETERALAELGFDRIDLLRPGLLLGDRADSRPAESVAQVLAPVTNPLMQGPLRRYRAIAADAVAAAAVAALARPEPGRHVHENAALLALAAA